MDLGVLGHADEIIISRVWLFLGYRSFRIQSQSLTSPIFQMISQHVYAKL